MFPPIQRELAERFRHKLLKGMIFSPRHYLVIQCLRKTDNPPSGKLRIGGAYLRPPTRRSRPCTFQYWEWLLPASTLSPPLRRAQKQVPIIHMT